MGTVKVTPPWTSGLNCSLLLSLNKDREASLHPSCQSGMLCRRNSGCGSVTAARQQCKPASVLCFAVQMRGGSVCSHWPCQQMVMRSLAGEYNGFLSDRVGSNALVHLQIFDRGFYSVLEQMTAACTSLTWSRINGHWRLVYLPEATVFGVLLGLVVPGSNEDAEIDIGRSEEISVSFQQYKLLKMNKKQDIT